MTLNKLIWKLTKEIFTLHEINFEEAAKNMYSLLSIMLHITPPMNPDSNVTYQTVHLFGSEK